MAHEGRTRELSDFATCCDEGCQLRTHLWGWRLGFHSLNSPFLNVEFTLDYFNISLNEIKSLKGNLVLVKFGFSREIRTPVAGMLAAVTGKPISGVIREDLPLMRNFRHGLFK